MQKCKNLISLGLLLLFFTAQFTSLHQFSHDDSSSSCQICLVGQQLQTLDYIQESPTSFPAVVYILVLQEMETEYAFAKAISTTGSHTTRPPPVIC